MLFARITQQATLRLLWCLPLAACAQALNAKLNEQVVMLKVGSGWSATELETTFYKPNGDGPFPLVIINHGKASGDPRFQERARFPLAAGEFVARGYMVVMPMRRGFSKSGGAYILPGCNIRSSGILEAESIRDVLAVLTKRADVDARRIVVIGQSHGGLTTMALGTFDIPGVRGLINFAGGLRVVSGANTCQWDRTMADAFEAYGARTKIPSIWFYGDNDSYWGPELPKTLHQRYTKAGGKARLVSYGVFEAGDAHGMFAHRLGVKVWLQPLEEFLRSIGMPADVIKPAQDAESAPAAVSR